MSSELFQAIALHDTKRVIELLCRGVDPNANQAEYPKFTALQAAIDELEDGGSLDVLVALLARGAIVDGWDEDHESTPLLMAMLRGQLEAARILLDAGADPNVRGCEGDSPLRSAVENDDLQMAGLLLSKGASKTIDDPGEPQGRTALGIAVEHLNAPMVKLLLEAGARLNAIDLDFATARERLPPPEASDPQARAAILELLTVSDNR